MTHHSERVDVNPTPAIRVAVHRLEVAQCLGVSPEGSWAACLAEDEAVIVVLTNHEVDDGHFAFSHRLARPLVNALRAD